MNTRIIFSIATATLFILGTELKSQVSLNGNTLTSINQYIGSSNAYDLYFKVNGVERMRLANTTAGSLTIGNVGVNTLAYGKVIINGALSQNNTPDNLVGLSIDKQLNAGYARRLFFIPHSNGGVNPLAQPGDVGIFWTDGGNGVTGSGNRNVSSALVIASHSNGSYGIRITSDGSVGIGVPLLTNPNNYKLAVNGIIGARGVKVEVNSWPDYVFDNTYKLKTIKELENFILTYNHLPNVPSAAEAEKQGIDIGVMNAKLLEKVEELYLYIIEQNKRIEILEQDRMIKK